MKKLAVLALLVILALNQSQASMTSVEKVTVYQKRSELMSQMRTKSVLARAVPRAQRRLLVTNNASDGDDGPPGSDELDLQTPYRRPKLVETPDSGNDVSDYIAIRLAVARARAMKVYRTKWA